MAKKQPVYERAKTILEEIHPEFVESGAKTINVEDVAALAEHLDEVLTAFSSGGPLGRYSRDVVGMTALIKDYAAGTYRDVPLWTISVITFTLLYVLKPIDIIPDSLPVIGQLDDVIVVTHCLDITRKQLDAYAEWSREQKDD